MPLRVTLKKRAILRGYQAFSSVLSKGKSLQTGIIRCYYLVSAGKGTGVQAGFTVSRTIHQPAARNRLRRLMKEAYRLNRRILFESGNQTTGTIRLVFMCTPGAEGHSKRLTYESVERPIVTLLTEVHRQLS